MRILLISKEIYPDDPTGLGISTKSHCDILSKKGHILKVVSINEKKNSNFNIEIKNILHFILKYFQLKNKAKKIIADYNPDIIIIESLQTLISELFLFSVNKKRKIILISHGISIYPYKISLKYIFRFLVYLFYLPVLFVLLAKVDYFFSLNWTNKSDRHLDEKIYKLLKNKKIVKYFNTSRFEKTINNNGEKIKKIISCFGYMGEIKNQKEFIKIAEYFRNQNIIFKIIFQNSDGNYLKDCKEICKKKKFAKC